MARPSGAHTHPPSGLSAAVVIACAAAAWVLAHTRQAHHAGQAAAHLLTVVLIGLLAVLGLAVAGGLVLAGLALRRRREPRQVERGWTATVEPRLPDGYDPPSAALDPPSVVMLDPPPAGPREVHYHVHVHEGADAQAVARALREHT